MDDTNNPTTTKDLNITYHIRLSYAYAVPIALPIMSYMIYGSTLKIISFDEIGFKVTITMPNAVNDRRCSWLVFSLHLYQ